MPPPSTTFFPYTTLFRSAEVLTDNGGQFTGRYVKPQPVEVLFERICRDNGIKQRLTKPASPTTTGKIERFHKTLDRKSTRLNSSHPSISYAVFCLKKKNN